LHQDFFENDEHSFAKKVEETFFENVDCWTLSRKLLKKLNRKLPSFQNE
jgi:hypothetical protein